MRAGYLTTLAARTLGMTPVLRPATPSRFEPEGPQPELSEVVEVHETEPILATTSRPAPARAGEQPEDTATKADRPRQGFFEYDVPKERHAMVGAHDSATPDVSELAEDLADAAGRRPSALLPSSTADPEPFAEVVASSPGSVRRPGRAAPSMAVQEYQSPDWADLAAEAAPPPRAPGGQAAWPVEVIQTGRSRQQARADNRPGQPAAASGTEPAIIVRIGRVDVRAVQAASPPAPATRPRPAAGPSLAEHLLARDRRRR